VSAGEEPVAVLLDFGGVLTTSVFAAFTAFGAAIGDDPALPLRLLRDDPESGRLLVEAESGRLSDADFDAAFAARLAAHGVDTEPTGLIRRMQAGLRPDETMLAAARGLRAAGHPVALVSNSFGADLYDDYDLDALADVHVISGEVGVRKPSRRIYALACERLGVAPERCVMVDDVEQNLTGAARLGIAGVLHRDADATLAELAERFGAVPAAAA
jgi:putative hydrolase of the HAD superfamily